MHAVPRRLYGVLSRWQHNALKQRVSRNLLFPKLIHRNGIVFFVLWNAFSLLDIHRGLRKRVSRVNFLFYPGLED